MPEITSRSLLLLFLSSFLAFAISVPAQVGGSALQIRDTVVPVPIPSTDAIICTGLNLTGSCLVTPGNDPTCHDLSGADADFANAINSVLIPPGPESACGFYKRHDCVAIEDIPDEIIALIGGDPGDNIPFNDLGEFGWADVINSYHCAFVP